MLDDEGEHKKRRILNNLKNYRFNICREVRMFVFFETLLFIHGYERHGQP
jgi:hypothetical protein